MTRPSITHQPATKTSAGTFDLKSRGHIVGYLSYTLSGSGTMYVDYVEVNQALRGKKMGERLVGAAVEWARANAHHVVPHCSYARAVMVRTKAFQDVLKK